VLLEAIPGAGDAAAVRDGVSVGIKASSAIHATVLVKALRSVMGKAKLMEFEL